MVNLSVALPKEKSSTYSTKEETRNETDTHTHHTHTHAHTHTHTHTENLKGPEPVFFFPLQKPQGDFAVRNNSWCRCACSSSQGQSAGAQRKRGGEKSLLIGEPPRSEE